MGYAALRYTLGVTLLAGLYYLTGKLGLALATPPGFATVIWPAAGIALGIVLIWGMKYLPGVFIGSLLVNLDKALHQAEPASLSVAVTIGVGIGCGAVLQAAAEVYLCRLAGVAKRRFDNDKIIASFYVSTAISCCVAPLIGVTVLYLAGAVQPEQILVNITVWLTGDVLGAWIFAPVAIFIFAPASFASNQRRLAVVGPLMTAFVVFVVVQASAGKEAHRRQQLKFEQEAATIASRFRERVNGYLDILASIESYFNSIDEVTYAQYKSFTEILTTRYPGIQALSWNRRVTAADRKNFEADIQSQGFAGYRIKDPAPGGTFNRAPQRDVYFPVTFVAPYKRNSTAHGFDTYHTGPPSGDKRRKVLDAARDSGVTHVTGRIEIVQDRHSRYGLLFYRPVYSAPASTIAERQRLHRGFCAGVFFVPDLLRSTSEAATARNMQFQLLDVENGQLKTLFDSRTPDNKEPAKPLTIAPGAIRWAARMPVAGRTWQLHFQDDRLQNASQFPLVWNVVVSGFLFTSLAGAFVLLVTGRTDRVEQIVRQRTAELERSNANLERSNIDLQHFAYVASHDLQTPLRSISGFSQLLQAEVKESSEKVDRYVFRIVRATQRMQALIDDLLEYSRVGSSGHRFEKAALEDALADSLVMLDSVVQESGAVITHDKLPELIFDPSQITQVFQNLIGNSIKYMPAGSKPAIHVAAVVENGLCKVTVRDNGIGISKKHQERIFDIFRRLHTQTEYAGTGIGLALCRRIVQRHGGRIWVESELGAGSEFHFVIPETPPAEDSVEPA